MTSVKSFFEGGNFTIKFMTIDAQGQSDVDAVLISPYDLCLVSLILWHKSHLFT